MPVVKYNDIAQRKSHNILKKVFRALTSLINFIGLSYYNKSKFKTNFKGHFIRSFLTKLKSQLKLY